MQPVRIQKYRDPTKRDPWLRHPEAAPMRLPSGASKHSRAPLIPIAGWRCAAKIRMLESGGAPISADGREMERV